MLTDKLIPTPLCPIKIVTDNDAEYKNKIVDEVHKKLKTGRNYTSPYHAQSNGKLEGWHRMLGSSF